MRSSNEKLVPEVPEIYQKYLVRAGSEFEGLVGVETDKGFAQLKTVIFSATANDQDRDPRKNNLDLTPLNALPRLEQISLEFMTISYHTKGGPGLQNLKEANFFSCHGVTKLFDFPLPKLEVAWMHACDLYSLGGLLECPNLKHVEIRGTPIDRSRHRSAPSILDHVHSYFTDVPMAYSATVKPQLAELERRGVRVTFDAT